MLQGFSPFGYSDPYMSGLYTAYGPQAFVSTSLSFLSLVVFALKFPLYIFKDEMFA